MWKVMKMNCCQVMMMIRWGSTGTLLLLHISMHPNAHKCTSVREISPPINELSFMVLLPSRTVKKPLSDTFKFKKYRWTCQGKFLTIPEFEFSLEDHNWCLKVTRADSSLYFLSLLTFKALLIINITSEVEIIDLEYEEESRPPWTWVFLM
jgi:hypothetical protein